MNQGNGDREQEQERRPASERGRTATGRLSVRVGPETLAALDTHVEDERAGSRSAVVRAALREYLNLGPNRRESTD